MSIEEKVKQLSLKIERLDIQRLLLMRERAALLRKLGTRLGTKKVHAK